MITKLFPQRGCIIAEFTDLKRFTLAVTEEVKTELKPILSENGVKFIFNLQNVEFIDSSGIGCIISLVKTAMSAATTYKIYEKCNKILQNQTMQFKSGSNGNHEFIAFVYDFRHRERCRELYTEF